MKKPNRQFSPTDDGSSTPSKTTTPSNSTSGIPAKDADFVNTAGKVRDAWLANSAITLVYKTADQFAAMVSQLTLTYTARKAAGSGRPAQTQSLKDLDTQINKAVTEVKSYINYKFKTGNDTAQYARYGIVKEGKNYRLPKDRDSRVLALPLMVSGIAADGFGAEQYGSAFWGDMLTQYQTALSAANNTDSTVGIGVAGKNQLKKEIKKVMKSLRLVIEGNYPDTYKGVLRQWGWQKEDY